MYVNFVARYAWPIGLATLFGTALVFLYMLTRPPLYASTATLESDSQGLRMPGEADLQRNSATTADVMVLTLQRLLLSPPVVEGTVRALDLGRYPEFNPHGNSPIEKIDQQVSRAASVDRPPGTLLLDLTVRTRSPQLSADIANALAKTLQDRQYRSRVDAITASSSYMTSQLDGLRTQMEKSQSALVQYQIQNDVLDPDDKTNIMRSRLSQVNDDLSGAQSDRIKLESEYNVARQGDVDALAMTAQGANLHAFEQRLQADKQKLATLALVLGPRNEQLIQQQRMVAFDEAALGDEAQHVENAAYARYRAALDREGLIQNALQQQKRAMDAFDLRAVRYASLKAEADSSTKLYYDLLQRIKEADVDANYRAADLSVASRAEPHYTKVYPRPLLYAGLAMIAILIAGISAAILVGTLDQTMTQPAQVEQWLGVELLGALPEQGAITGPLRYGVGDPAAGAGPLAGLSPDKLGFREAVLSLRSGLLLSGDAELIAITSSVPAEGKSTIAANLAAAIASLGGRTLLIDADMRKPRQHSLFGVRARPGLAEVLRGTSTIEAAAQPAASQPGLMVLVAGARPASPAEVLHDGLPRVLDQARASFDRIVIDCPPVLVFADASEVAALAGSVVLVIGAGRTPRNSAQEALRGLLARQANIRGAILNRVSTSRGHYYEHYRAYKSYYGDGDETQVEG